MSSLLVLWSLTSVCGLFRSCVQLCSGLVDLVVCVGCHGNGGHRFAFTGERFVGLVAENIAEVAMAGRISGTAAGTSVRLSDVLRPRRRQRRGTGFLSIAASI